MIFNPALAVAHYVATRDGCNLVEDKDKKNKPVKRHHAVSDLEKIFFDTEEF